MSNFDSILSTTTRQPLKKPKRRSGWKWFFVIVCLGAAVGLFAAGRIVLKTNKIFTNSGNIFTRVGQLIVSPDKNLIGEDQGVVNILLLGVGGEGHDGTNLTDTIIVASLNLETHEVVLTSIPRDFMVQIPKVGLNKINAVYAYAYRDNPNTAGSAALAAAEKITGFTIPYYALVDFKGFVKAVDHVGGVDVAVDRTFTDSSFPNDFPFDTKGYLSPVTFTKGPQHMNGQTALIFARSRHSDNSDEGSDFARSERQKKILIALKGKVTSLKLGNLATLNNLLSDFTENFRTNLEPYELKRLADIGLKIDNDKVYSLSLEPQGDLICSRLVDLATGQPAVAPAPAPTPAPTDKTKTATPPAATETAPAIQNIYVVKPCEGKTIADIQNFLKNYLELGRLKKEGTIVEIQNSTGQATATTSYKKLSAMGIDVRFVTFKGKVTYNQTVLYDNSHGAKPDTLDYLQSNYSFTASDINYPNSIADFVIILGKDSL
jgi:LCP family protein required for cell wall assembly